MTAQNMDISTSRVTRLTLNVDNSTHIIPHPFVYHLDPVITSISPIESFISGGRPLIITGHHLNVPQTIKLLVYHEHYTNIFNGSYCMAENDTWIMCLTPAINKEMLISVGGGDTTTSQTRGPMMTADNQMVATINQDQQPMGNGNNVNSVNLLNDIQYENGGLRLKMSIVMDDVRSVRQLDEYYPHLPHYITYYDDPKVYRFPTDIVVYSVDGLVIEGDNLKMAYLKEDIIVTIGIKLCTITSIRVNQIVCTPPQEPVQPTDERGYPTERQLPQIVVTIGANIRQELGYMQYEPSSFYSSSSRSGADMTNDSFWAGPQKALIAIVGLFTFGLAVAMLFVVAFSRYRNSKAEKEYKRIQLQMGSLDVNGSGGLPNGGGGLVRGANCDLDYSSSGHHSGVPSLSSPSNKKLSASYPSSPLTNFSTVSSGGVVGNGTSVANHTIHPHITKINGLTTKYTTNQTPLIGNGNSEQIVSGQNSWTLDNLSSSKSSSGGSPMQKSIERPLISNMNHHHHHQSPINHNNLGSANDHQQHNYQTIERDSIYNSSLSRRYNWHSDAPTTIVPYAVIEACNIGDRHNEDNKTMRNYV